MSAKKYYFVLPRPVGQQAARLYFTLIEVIGNIQIIDIRRNKYLFIVSRHKWNGLAKSHIIFLKCAQIGIQGLFILKIDLLLSVSDCP